LKGLSLRQMTTAYPERFRVFAPRSRKHLDIKQGQPPILAHDMQGFLQCSVEICDPIDTPALGTAGGGRQSKVGGRPRRGQRHQIGPRGIALLI
jgi:hypothetical protein